MTEHWTHEDWRRFVEQLKAEFRVGPRATPEALEALRPDLELRGALWQRDSGRRLRPRLLLPDGAVVDVADIPGDPWYWNVVLPARQGVN